LGLGSWGLRLGVPPWALGLGPWALGHFTNLHPGPRIEYASWVRAKEVTRVLPRLLALHTDAPLRNASSAFLAALSEERKRLLTFYSAALHAYNGERESWARDLKSVLEQDRNNSYYRWVGGGGR